MEATTRVIHGFFHVSITKTISLRGFPSFNRNVKFEGIFYKDLQTFNISRLFSFTHYSGVCVSKECWFENFRSFEAMERAGQRRLQDNVFGKL